jgi:hypothetical protein
VHNRSALEFVIYENPPMGTVIHSAERHGGGLVSLI